MKSQESFRGLAEQKDCGGYACTPISLLYLCLQPQIGLLMRFSRDRMCSLLCSEGWVVDSPVFFLLNLFSSVSSTSSEWKRNYFTRVP